jgi:hydroxyethylthiazole kinase-like uncharacterized protein yjeF
MLSPLLSIAEIRNIEHQALAEVAPYTLMYRAGIATATLAAQLVSDTHRQILIVAGPGNNGGDAFEAAYQLARNGHNVTIICDTAHARTLTDIHHPACRARTTNARWVDLAQYPELIEQPWALVIDGLFGIGLKRPVSGYYATLIQSLNALECPVLAIDIPSGLDADTGTVVGHYEGIAVQATHTLTFIADKPGLHTCDGVDYCGLVTVASLGTDALVSQMNTCLRNTPACFIHAFAPRLRNSHKGSFGDLMIVGGAQGMAGAAVLSARAGLHTGAGRIFVAFAGTAPDYDPLHPELMFRQASQIEFSRAVIVAGPGLGTSDIAAQLIERIVHSTNSLVLDADALNLIADNAAMQHALRARTEATTLMTPHPLEAARLLGCTVTEIQHNRLDAAKLLARQYNATVVLKGAGTVIATTPEQTFINTTGNPALATGGTGDVLAGVCGALLAQRLPADKAAMAAVWLHGKAADTLVAKGVGPVGLTASELIPEIRLHLNTLTAQNQ